MPAQIIYVNGINTSLEEAQTNANCIALMTGQEVTLVHNPSCTIVSSLLESFWGRWFFWVKPTNIAKKVTNAIRELSEEAPFNEIFLIGHSQGCIIINNAIRLLSEGEKTFLWVTFFAPTNVYEAKNAHYEYFCNDNDPVVDGLIGTGFVSLFRRFKPESRMKGKLYMRRGMGHGFLESYLDVLEEFTGCNNSVFYRSLVQKIEKAKQTPNKEK